MKYMSQFRIDRSLCLEYETQHLKITKVLKSVYLPCMRTYMNIGHLDAGIFIAFVW